MSNALRNTIILTLLSALLITGFWVINHNLNKKASILKAKNKKTATTIAELEYQISKRDSLLMAYELMQMMQAQQSKILVGADSANQSYRYLLKVLGWMGNYIPFNFALTSGDKAHANYNEYVISGRTHYADLMRLTKHLEHQRAVLTLEDYTVSMDTHAASDTVSFSMVFRTHFQEGGPALDEITQKKFPAPYILYSLFKSRIYDSTPESDTDPHLPDISTSRLIGLAEGKVFLRDTNGLIHILSPGSRVRYGYLKEIDLTHSMAVFKLNLHGLEETRYLQVSSTQ